MPLAAQILGPMLLLAAPLLLAKAWRQGDAARAARLGGWAALGAALILFAIGFGPMRGPALALTILPFVALPIIALRRDRRVPRRTVPERQADTTAVAGRRLRATARTTARTIARTGVALPLAGAAAILAAMQASLLWGSMTGGIVASLALAILFWGAAMLWAMSDPRLWRPAGGLALIALTSGLPLLLP